MTPRVFAVALVFATLLGAVPRLNGIGDEITYDEAEYAEAARAGVIANALDRGRTFEFRHEHPPLLAYGISLSLRLFGEREWAVRLPSLLASLLLIPIAGALCAQLVASRAAGLLVALLLAASPVHAVSARVGDHHAIATLCLLAAVACLGRAIAESSPRFLRLAAVALAVLIATSEFGVVVAGACALVLAILPNPFVSLRAWPPRIGRPAFAAAAIAVTGAVLLWPAGLFKLDLARSFYRYSFQAVHSYTGKNQMAHSSPMVYLEQYAQIAPAFLAVFLATLAFTIAALVRRRVPPALTPLALLALLLTVTMHLQVPAAFRYSLYAATLLVVLAGWLLELLSRGSRTRVIAAWGIALITAAASLASAARYAPDRPGFDDAARYLLARSGDDGGRVLASSPFCLAFTLRAAAPNASPPARIAPGGPHGDLNPFVAGRWFVDEYAPGVLQEAERRALEAGAYDWVVLDAAPGRNAPDDRGIALLDASGPPEISVEGSEPGNFLKIYRRPVTAPR
ncbi:MAG: glycosyltransferase family 39 protein [bacterium]